jgi:predicted AlkP superfamily phosphohydrolase/phosphomutase
VNKVLVIGLDGVPLGLVEDWIKKGHLPRLKALIEGGATGLLKSTVPHTSGPAWSSFMTGKNPGKTGVYDFLYRKQDSYVFYPNNTLTRAGKPVWDLLSEAGKKVGVLNVPMTYPVTPLNGALISGFLTPYYAEDYFYPNDLLEKIEKQIGQKYYVYPLETFNDQNPQAYFDASHRMLDMLTSTFSFLMDDLNWDFMMGVFFDTDRILHQVWHYLDDKHPMRKADPDVDKSAIVIEYFNHLDRCIGQLVDQAGPETNIIIMSDHGMGPAYNMITLNTWLLNQKLVNLVRGPLTFIKRALFRLGFTLRNSHRLLDLLKLAKHAEYKLLYSADKILKKVFLSFDDVDWARTSVYSVGRDIGPLFINLKGREPKGTIEEGEEYTRVREEIAAAAREMTDPKTGKKLAKNVLFREQVYKGPYLDMAPDLIVEPEDEDIFYGLSDFGSNLVYESFYRYSGMHRSHGMLVMYGPDFKKGMRLEGAEIIDLAPTILQAMGQSIPSDMDGKPLLGAFREPQKPKWHAVEGAVGAGPQDSGYSDKDAYDIEDRLRKLGYLG